MQYYIRNAGNASIARAVPVYTPKGTKVGGDVVGMVNIVTG